MSVTSEYLMHLTTDDLRALLGETLAGTSDTPMTTQQAADFLQLHESTVREMATAGTIPAGRFGREWRFSRTALLMHCKGRKP